ncbi:Ppx/GppA phosphatase family protein [Methylocystis sp. IM3]|jgi:exopolyphosphatase/guanosine-5'-triphosphate,3'-diphosphate pyrophosphatase|uniref:Ppx/GppA phosphatase family protein n=1 Tax=unclassified Methylocystis TaxID=2625913 RepID=UPI000FB71A53|nr:MAG: Ppx/GppA family phosphatase [Hyphomicrobiales bacterium]
MNLAGTQRPADAEPGLEAAAARQAGVVGANTAVPRTSAPWTGHTYAALDLGTNNCRLLIARPERRPRRRNSDFLRVIDAFSRIVRLGEGLGRAGRISEAAIERTIAALDVCRAKMETRGVTRARLVATQACRGAANGDEFVARVRERTGLELEVIDRETEARFAARGCGSLADPHAASVLLFDIGGGSTELVWLTRSSESADARELHSWTSLELGVVTLAEHFGGRVVDARTFAAMKNYAREALLHFVDETAEIARCSRFHLLGTSGTVTTLAGVHLGLERYDRWRVDGLWMSDAEATRAIDRLRAMDFEERVANGCIGPQRADLVLAGCAIFEAIREMFPAARTRIADRGLREGMLLELMEADGVLVA